MSNLSSYIPQDRRQALAHEIILPDRTTGAALFADISGFTPLTEAVIRELGPQRGPEELTRQLNLVYDALIGQIDRFSGSVISFAGDAITCWFTDDDGHLATGAAQAMQEIMGAFAAVRLPSGQTIPLAVKIVVTHGPVRRFVVGDPQIQLLDAIAGETISRLATGEHYATKGEILLGPEVVANLGDLVEVKEWRTAEEDGERFAVVASVRGLPDPATTPELANLPDEKAQPWLLPPVFHRLVGTQDEFLAELRPAVPVFLRFDGLSYDTDEEVGTKLDAYIRWVQTVLARYEGFLLELIIGDKGSYIYATFGALMAHDDDPARAVAAALELRNPPFEYITTVQIGISQGRIRAGAYGGTTRGNYGAQGNEVNLAARLMQRAGNAQVLISKNIAESVERQYELKALGQITVKGKKDPLLIWEAVSRRLPSAQRPAFIFINTLVGREAELRRFDEAIETILKGNGQVVRVEGSPGIGKSHLAAELIERAIMKGMLVSLGATQSTMQNTPYVPWRQLFRALFGLPDALPEEDLQTTNARQIARLTEVIGQANRPDWSLRLPLLGDLLALPIPDNPTTAAFEPKVRQSSLFGLVVEMIKQRAEEQPLLLLLEDVHWLDEASQALTVTVARAIGQSPILLALFHRPALDEARPVLPLLNALPYHQSIDLGELSNEGVTALATQRVGGPLSPLLLNFIQMRAQGNPFYIEELLDILREKNNLRLREDAHWDLSEEILLELQKANLLTTNENGEAVFISGAQLTGVDLDLPDSIQSIVLTRLDRIPEGSKLSLKVASVIGRTFDLAILVGSHPLRLKLEMVTDQLEMMKGEDFVRVETPQPQIIYLFKHNITHEVAYETLLFGQRRLLHEAVARWFESNFNAGSEVQFNREPPPIAESNELSPFFSLLAHHWARAEDPDRERYYSILTAEQSSAQYANEQALTYLNRALTLTPEDNHAIRFRLLKTREEIHDRRAARTDQALDLTTLAALADALNDDKLRATVELRAATFATTKGDYPAGIVAAQRAVSFASRAGDTMSEALGLRMWGMMLVLQGKYTEAMEILPRALEMARTNKQRLVEARCLSAIAYYHQIQNEQKTAQTYYRQALAIFVEESDLANQVYCLNNLGPSYMQTEDYVAARECLEQGITIAQITALQSLEYLSFNLGWLHLTTGDFIYARPYFERALAFGREAGDRGHEANALISLGAVEIGLGNPSGALPYIEEAHKIIQAIGSGYYESTVLQEFGRAYFYTGDHLKAHDYLERALALAKEFGSDDKIWTITFMGHVEAALGNLATAQTHYNNALEELAHDDQTRRIRMDILAGLVRVALARGDAPEALASAGEILSWIAEHGLAGIREPFLVYLTCYRAIAASGDTAQGEEVLAMIYALLQEQASQILDPAIYNRFLANVPAHQEICTTWETIEEMAG